MSSISSCSSPNFLLGGGFKGVETTNQSFSDNTNLFQNGQLITLASGGYGVSMSHLGGDWRCVVLFHPTKAGRNHWPYYWGAGVITLESFV